MTAGTCLPDERCRIGRGERDDVTLFLGACGSAGVYDLAVPALCVALGGAGAGAARRGLALEVLVDSAVAVIVFAVADIDLGRAALAARVEETLVGLAVAVVVFVITALRFGDTGHRTPAVIGAFLPALTYTADAAAAVGAASTIAAVGAANVHTFAPVVTLLAGFAVAVVPAVGALAIADYVDVGASRLAGVVIGDAVGAADGRNDGGADAARVFFAKIVDAALAFAAVRVSSTRGRAAFAVRLRATGRDRRCVIAAADGGADEPRVGALLIAAPLVFALAAVFFAITAPVGGEALGVVAEEGVAHTGVTAHLVAVVAAVGLAITGDAALAGAVVTGQRCVVRAAFGVHAATVLTDLVVAAVVILGAGTVTVVRRLATTREVFTLTNQGAGLGVRRAPWGACALSGHVDLGTFSFTGVAVGASVGTADGREVVGTDTSGPEIGDTDAAHAL